MICIDPIRRRLRALIVAIVICAMPVRAEIFDVAPTVRTAAGAVVPSTDTSRTTPVIQIFTAPERVSRDSVARRGDVILRMEVDETIAVNRPFKLVLRAYNRLGLPDADFGAPVTFECANGIIPVVSSRSWRNGYFEDTVIIVRPGKNTRIVAVAGGATAILHSDVFTPPPDKATWVKLADEHQRTGKIEDAIFCLKKASSFDPYGDPVIEKRIARLYLDREQWAKAEEHFKRAIRAIALTSSTP